METDRTYLRRAQSDDLNLVKLLLQDGIVMKTTGFKTVQSNDECCERLKSWENDEGVWLVFSKESNDFVGWFMLKYTVSENFPEIGFMICRRFWNMGYATEVATKVLELAFKVLNVSKVIASVSNTNQSSINVLKKVGMEPSLEFRGEPDISYFQIKNNESLHQT